MCKHDVKRLVFSSTCATYGVPQSLPITEELTQTPINPYGWSKLMVEQILKDYAEPYAFNSIALRYFNAAGCAADGSLGERHDPETHLIPLVLFEALRMQNGGAADATKLMVFGDDFDTPDGTCVRDYIHVTDLCSAHVRALLRLEENANNGAEQAPRRAGDPPELVSDASRAMQTLGWQPEFVDIRQSIEHAWQWFSRNEPNIAA